MFNSKFLTIFSFFLIIIPLLVLFFELETMRIEGPCDIERVIKYFVFYAVLCVMAANAVFYTLLTTEDLEFFCRKLFSRYPYKLIAYYYPTNWEWYISIVVVLPWCSLQVKIYGIKTKLDGYFIITFLYYLIIILYAVIVRAYL